MPVPASPLGVIFDVDGVLVDSYDAHFRSWQWLMRSHGREYTEEQFAQGFGRTSREVLREQWEGDAPSDDELAELARVKEAHYRDAIAHSFPALDGARELIHALKADGFKLAIGSSGPPENVQIVIDQLGVDDLIDARVTGSDVTKGKPHPQVFLLAAERLGLPPARCLVFEDAPAGLQAAHAAGIRSIGVASTGRTRAELTRARRVVDTLREVTPADVRAIIEGP